MSIGEFIPIQFILLRAWNWIVSTGINLALLIALMLLVPRLGRFALFWIQRRIENRPSTSAADSADDKTQLAIAGVAVYIGQLILYFLLFVFLLKTLGFSLTGAAIPATVASAAIGLGAQSIIADFLAGFFILTEKQFGVGDWVRFEGNGIEAEGTVIQVTMRATQIRTLAEETVLIPNSTARVCINASNHWSRAVVNIPVPLLGSSSVDEAIERSERAAQRALDRPEVKKELLGELVSQPAVKIEPPTTVGMPWLMTMRFMVQATAGNHWMVERAIRRSILDEFWAEYGSATTTSGRLQTDAALLTPAPEEEPAPATAQQPDLPPTEQLRMDPAAQETSILPALTPDAQDGDSAGADTEEKDAAAGRRHAPTHGPRAWLTLHGWVRPSTSLLAIGMLILLLLKALSLQTGEGSNDGILAPPSYQPPVSTPAPQPLPSPTYEEEPTTTAETEAPGQTYSTESSVEPSPGNTAPTTGEQPSNTPAPTQPGSTPEPSEGGGYHTNARGQSGTAGEPTPNRHQITG
ncbi:mechanosensitive ion channel family protein [Corynebacterium uropygiale]|uniref:Mechanosensitive ion channel family protein n=1 Tax=Corynebacterium uropygiale TaxID=1775911 RepID=A0A9X1QSZ6_9CORY|nr:mechanosensitive ion channel domain-containing protein [Corynebacterium uropygiale]MCF4007004.1 mechanosensitive ion channel family protein [Corynebacterium uropygiale]